MILEWTGKVRWEYDVQSVGKYVSIQNLVVTLMDGTKLAINFSELQNVNKKLYNEIYQYSKSQLIAEEERRKHAKVCV